MLLTGDLKKIYLRSEQNNKFEQNPDVADFETEEQFVLPGTICAVRSSKSSSDTFWLVKIKDSFEALIPMTDDYSNIVPAGHQYIEGKFLEKCETAKKGDYYKLQNKETYLYKESVVYPFVQLKESKKGLFLSNEERVVVLNYVENVSQNLPPQMTFHVFI